MNQFRSNDKKAKSKEKNRSTQRLAITVTFPLIPGSSLLEEKKKRFLLRNERSTPFRGPSIMTKSNRCRIGKNHRHQNGRDCGNIRPGTGGRLCVHRVLWRQKRQHIYIFCSLLSCIAIEEGHTQNERQKVEAPSSWAGHERGRRLETIAIDGRERIKKTVRLILTLVNLCLLMALSSDEWGLTY